VHTPVNISTNTIYRNVDDADDQFNFLGNFLLALRGVNTLTDDTITGAGLLRVSGSTTIDNSLTLDDTVTLANASMVTQNDSRLVIGTQPSDAATARNDAGATWTISSGSSIESEIGGSAFINLGTLLQTGKFSSEVNGTFYDRGGTIEIDDELDFFSGGSDRFVDDAISGAGKFQLVEGVLVGSDISTASTDLAAVRTSGDVTISSAFVDITSLAINNGSIVSLTGEGAQVGFDIEIVGGGTLIISGNDSVYTGSPTLRLVGGVTFDNQGDTTFHSDTGLIAQPYAGHQVTIENSAGATWTDNLSNISIFSGEGSGTSSFVNDGMFVEDTTDGANFNIDVVNNGTMGGGADLTDVIQHAPELSFVQTVSGTGTIDAGDDNVSFNAAVSSSQTVNFTSTDINATPTLILTDPSVFNGGTITGFDQNGATGDQIQLLTGASFDGYFANGGNTGGYLSWDDGAEKINIVGNYNPSGWSAANNIVSYGG
jgi:hypothetical protein